MFNLLFSIQHHHATLCNTENQNVAIQPSVKKAKILVNGVHVTKPVVLKHLVSTCISQTQVVQIKLRITVFLSHCFYNKNKQEFFLIYDKRIFLKFGVHHSLANV